jgi:N-acetylglucosaminyl-diphospho-decaprenol L-rhamnosyltransferase
MNEIQPVESPLLDIVIVVSNGDREHLRTCLTSLQRHPLTLGETTVHVVDNASQDQIDAMVAAEFPYVRYQRLNHNSGFPTANNIGLHARSGRYALVLNPDTEFVEDSLDHLIRLMEERPDIGMTGCRLVRRDGSFDHAAKRSFPTRMSALAHFTGVGRSPSASARLAQYRTPALDEHGTGEVDAVNGAFMLVRGEAITDVGLFDEAYWLYMEDLDWCYRFKQAGWTIWYDGGTTVIHVKGGSTVRRGHRGLRHNYAFHRSMARFYRKFYARRRSIADGAVYAAIWTKFVVSAIRSAVARRSIA